MEKSGYGKDGIFRSLSPPLNLPKDENANMVSFMFRDSSSYAHRLALADADSGEKLSFREFKDEVSIVGSGLCKLGIGKGDVVLLFSPNSIHVPLCFFGIVSIGAVATTVNPLYTAMEVAKQVQDSKSKFVITVTVPELWDKVKDLDLPAIVIGKVGYSKRRSSPIISFSEVLTMGAQNNPTEVIVKQTDTAALLYSSGTTGTNKGVVLTHRNFIASALMLVDHQELEGERHMTYLCLLPMFHVYGLAIITYAQLQRGNAVVSMGKFTLVGMLEAIQDYKITHLLLVPPIVIAVAKKNIVARYDLSSLKKVTSGAAPLGKDIMEECVKRISQATLIQGYGLTESCGIATITFPKEGNSHFGSAGTLVPGLEAKIASLETGRPLPPNQKGEIWLRGPNIMTGYFNNPDATKITLDKEGWLHTGDMGYFDEDGGLYIVDRIKELIKYKGFQVAPAELEGLLLTHPQILDSGVIPFPDLNAGEVPVAYVVRTPGSTLTEQDVMDYVAKQVAPFKRLHRVNFVNSIPKSSSGKILRRELIAKAKSKL